jgi:hypothetical protein
MDSLFKALTVLLLIGVVTFTMFTFKVPFMKALWAAVRQSWKRPKRL